MRLNHFSSYKVKLYREVNHKIRYYSINLYPTLFGEYLLVKEYGGVSNKKPTGVIKEYYCHFEDSLHVINKLVQSKIQKGYLSLK